MKFKHVGLMFLVSIFLVLSSFALSWGEAPSRLFVVRASNNTLWKMICLGDSCSGWSQISGQFAQQPTLTWDERSERYVLVGVSTLGTIWRSTFYSDGSHNDNWVQLPGNTPSPVAAAGAILEVPKMGGNLSGIVDVATLETCPSYTNLSNMVVTLPRPGKVILTASGIYNPDTVNKYVRVCLGHVSGSSCDDWSPVITTPDLSEYQNYGEERRWALQSWYVWDPGSYNLYLKACKESGATGGLMYNDFAYTAHYK
jgi:hypothetical protein